MKFFHSSIVLAAIATLVDALLNHNSMRSLLPPGCTQDPKQINKIDSSLAEIALPFMLHQVLFCLKGSIFERCRFFLKLFQRQ